jgi:DNA-binding transcriptional MerR regulator
MSPSDSDLWTYAEIAHHIGVKPQTVHSYRRHGLLPEPDVLDDTGHPRWYPETIREWSRHRPGQRGR